MREKLRRKFVVYSVSAVAIVVISLGAIIVVGAYANIISRAERTLELISQNGGKFPTSAMTVPNSPKSGLLPRDYALAQHLATEAPFSTRYFSVKMKKPSILTVNVDNVALISPVEALRYAKLAVRKPPRGSIGSYKYLVRSEGASQLVVFLDCSRELDLFYHIVYGSIIFGLFMLLFSAFIAYLLSDKAIAPILEAYEKQKSFISDASHELKTPLSILQTNAEVLELTSGETQWTKSIRNQVRNLTQLVEGLVSLSTMDEDRGALPMQDLEISALAEDLARSFTPLATQAGKTLTAEINDKVMGRAEPSSLTQAMTILLDNAIKYSLPDSQIFFRVKKEGRQVKIATENLAEGLEPGNYDRLFERFYRLDTSHNQAKGGHGIGLALAQAIMTRHRGEAHAYSKDGKSLVIELTL